MKHICLLLLVTLYLPLCLGAAVADTSIQTVFTFSNSGINVTAGASTGYAVNGTAVTINAAGTYHFTGTCDNGTITVKKNTTGVRLVLDNLTLTANGTAPICCNSATQVSIFLPEGTVNTLADTASNNDELYPDNENAENAVIKLKKTSDAAIYGKGTLVLNANGKNGIKSGASARLRIKDPTLKITTAVNDAISSDNLLLIESGNLTLISADQGINCSPDDDDTDSLGKLVMYGGNLTITSTGDGIDTAGSAIFLDGTVTITAGNGYKGTVGTDDSKKGIKSTTLLGIEGGTFTMNCADDAFHSNDTVLIKGGTISVTTGDDAFHADSTLVIGNDGSSVGPDITITTCYEGLEAAYIYVCSGDIDITATDDGINAANSAVRDHKLVIFGGTIVCNAAGDGFDSNNITTIYGGDIQIFGAANGNNAALDSDGTLSCHGGTLIAVGYSEMAQTPVASASTQSCVAFGSASSMMGQGGGMGGGGMGGGGMGGGMGRIIPPGGQPGQPGGGGSWQNVNNLSIAAGNALVIMDSSGNTLYSTTAVKTANHVVFTSPALSSNSVYYLYVNGTQAAQSTAQTYNTATITRLTIPAIILSYDALADLPALDDSQEEPATPLRDITLLTFSDNAITPTAGPDSAFTIDGTSLAFSGAGTYELTGTCANGSIAVDKNVTGITIILNGLTLSSQTTAPFLAGKGTSVTMTVTNDNTLADTSDNAEKAVLKIKSNAGLALNGSGALTLNAQTKNGLKGGAESTITIKDISLAITAPNDAISSDHQLVISSGTFKLTADGDAIKAEPDDDDLASSGDITIQGGKFTLHAGDDGIQSSGNTTFTGGDIAIVAGGCGVNCSKALAISGESETPRLVVTSSSTAIKASTLTRNGAILKLTASKSGIVADDIAFGEGSTELYVADENDGIPISAWKLTAGTLFVAANTTCARDTSLTCLVFQAYANTADAIAITDAEGNTLLSSIATQPANTFMFASATLANNGTFTLWLNSKEADSCSFDSDITVDQAITTGWNMLYLGILPDEDARKHLSFFTYDNSIPMPVSTPVAGHSYVIYNSGNIVQLTGSATASTDIHLDNGWNFVGIPLPTAITNDMTAWQWNGTTFMPVTKLEQGNAYWIYYQSEN